MALTPQSLQVGLGKDVANLVSSAKLMARKNAKVVHLFDETAKLAGADPSAANYLYAQLHQVVGDIDSALDFARRLVGDDSDRLQATVLANLGYPSEALPLYRKSCSPHSGAFSASYPLGLSIGAIQTVAAFCDQAQAMKLQTRSEVPLEDIYAAASILEAAGISDEDISTWMSVAGEVLRDYGLTFVGDIGISSSRLSGEDCLVRICYKLAASAATTTALYLEFIGRLVARGINMPNELLIAFEGD